jgi:hypothetical protein
MNNTKNIFKAFLVTVFVAMFAFQGAAFAGKACNELKSKECSAKKTCSWVKGYTKKDKTKVKGHCKAKAKKK